jgi:ferric-dicitrate binding protein FerR (iron transport regulator)
MRLHLSQGRVDVDVGEEGVGFTVVTPVGEVVDLGTRFAVNASVD